MDDAVKRFKARRQARLDQRTRIDDDEESTGGGRGNGANTRLPYGLAKGQGIDTEGMAPKEVWQALEGKGVSAKQEYQKLRKRNEQKKSTPNSGWKPAKKTGGVSPETAQQIRKYKEAQAERMKTAGAKATSDRNTNAENANRGLAIDNAFDKIMKGDWEKTAFSNSAKDTAPALSKAIGGVKKGQEVSWGRGEKTERARRKADGSWEIYDRETGEWYNELVDGEKLTSRDVARHMLATLGPMKHANPHLSLGVTVKDSDQKQGKESSNKLDKMIGDWVDRDNQRRGINSSPKDRQYDINEKKKIIGQILEGNGFHNQEEIDTYKKEAPEIYSYLEKKLRGKESGGETPKRDVQKEGYNKNAYGRWEKNIQKAKTSGYSEKEAVQALDLYNAAKSMGALDAPLGHSVDKRDFEDGMTADRMVKVMNSLGLGKFEVKEADKPWGKQTFIRRISKK